MTHEQFANSVNMFCDVLADTLIRKNRDYAPEDDALDNFRPKWGVSGEREILLYVGNKLNRIGNLLDRPNVVEGEGLLDSAMDIAGYMAILSILAKKNNIGNKTEVRHMKRHDRTNIDVVQTKMDIKQCQI